MAQPELSNVDIAVYALFRLDWVGTSGSFTLRKSPARRTSWPRNGSVGNCRSFAKEASTDKEPVRSALMDAAKKKVWRSR